MEAKETTLKEVGEMLAHVVEHMATKEELAATNKELKSFRQEFNDFRDETRQNFRETQAELADIRRDLDDLRSRVANIIGYGKEIDHGGFRREVQCNECSGSPGKARFSFLLRRLPLDFGDAKAAPGKGKSRRFKALRHCTSRRNSGTRAVLAHAHIVSVFLIQ